MRYSIYRNGELCISIDGAKDTVLSCYNDLRQQIPEHTWKYRAEEACKWVIVDKHDKPPRGIRKGSSYEECKKVLFDANIPVDNPTYDIVEDGWYVHDQLTHIAVVKCKLPVVEINRKAEHVH